MSLLEAGGPDPSLWHGAGGTPRTAQVNPTYPFTSLGGGSSGGCTSAGAASVPILFEKVRSLFSGEKLSACGTADGGERLPSGDEYKPLGAALWALSVAGAVLREGRRNPIRTRPGGASSCGDDSRRFFSEKRRPVESSRRWFWLQQADAWSLSLVSAQAPESVREGEGQGPGAGAASVHVLQPRCSCRPGSSCLECGWRDRSEYPGHTLRGGAAPVHLSLCRRSLVSCVSCQCSVHPAWPPSAHCISRSRIVCCLAGLRNLMTRN